MAGKTMPYILTAGGLSDIGLVRENNEDVWGGIEELQFFVLADGMGGHKGGEVASREAVSHLLKIIKKSFKGKGKSLEEAKEALQSAIIQVNQLVFKMGKSDHKLKGMGTTLSCIMIYGEEIILGHVGDSRIYRLRDKKLEQLTKDHSLLRELVDMGQISEKSPMDFAYKNIITKAIGTEPRVEPSVEIKDLKAGDIFLLCTDGLTDLLTPHEIEEIVKEPKSLEIIIKKLIQSANDKGGYDNITVVMVKLEEDEKENISRQQRLDPA
jgi:protein phosphatase